MLKLGVIISVKLTRYEGMVNIYPPNKNPGFSSCGTRLQQVSRSVLRGRQEKNQDPGTSTQKYDTVGLTNRLRCMHDLQYIYTPGSTYDGNQGARCSKGVLIINVVSELIKTLVHNIMFVAKEIMALSLTLPLPLPLPSRYRYWYQHRYRYCCRYHYHYYRYHYHYYRYR